MRVDGWDEGVHESIFCDRILGLKYFFDLKELPVIEKEGVILYGFQLQFWPDDSQKSKEVVVGERLPNIKDAIESTFASGLKKLSSINLYGNFQQSNKENESDESPDLQHIAITAIAGFKDPKSRPFRRENEPLVRFPILRSPSIIWEPIIRKKLSRT